MLMFFLMINLISDNAMRSLQTVFDPILPDTFVITLRMAINQANGYDCYMYNSPLRLKSLSQ